MNRNRSDSQTLSRTLTLGAFAAAIMFAAAGCSTTATPVDPPPPAAQGASAAQLKPPPDIHNCAIVTISSPTKYACNGEVYTSRQLTQMRADWAKQQQNAN
ncbi:MAG: hypothetical protein ACYDC3_04470 [Candidatus Binataceae bacterium]